MAEKLVTLAKKNTEATRRRAHQIFYVRVIASVYGNRTLMHDRHPTKWFPSSSDP
jgi:ribosomal protein L17